MSDDADVRILERAENAVGDLLPRLLLAVVDAGEDPIGLSQHVVGQIHAPFLQDVAFDAFEEYKASWQRLAELVDLLPLGQYAFGIEAPGHADALRVIRNGDVRQAALVGR